MWYMRPHKLYKMKRYELIHVKSNVSRNTEFRHVVKASSKLKADIDFGVFCYINGKV